MFIYLISFPQKVTAKLFQVKETLSEEVLTKMHAVAKPYDVPIITAVELKDADGILFGIPARFGMLPAQMKALFDSCGQLWMNDELHHKFVGTFFSTGSIGGGQESTTLTTMPFFAHMGMIYIPFGSHRKRPLPEGEVAGGSAWGAGTYSEKGREASEYELEIVQFQG